VALALLLAAVAARADEGAAATPSPADFGALPALDAERPFQPPRAQRLPLAGGGELWALPDATLPLLTVRVVVPGAGAAADPEAQAGLADYTAALLFEGGAGELPARALAEHVEGLGSHLAAWAELDAAFVEVTTLARHRDASLAFLGQVLTRPRLDAADARRLLEDRRTAVLLRRDEPGAVAHLVLRAALHGAASPYGHPVLGSEQSLAQLGDPVAAARGFYQAHYDPRRIIVVAAGDFVPAELAAVLDRSFADWSPGPSSAPAWPASLAAPAAAARLFVVDRPGAAQANILIGALGVARADPRAAALEVAATLLGGTFSSRLSHRLREELGLTYGVSAAAGFERATGVFAVETAVHTPRAVEGLREALRLITDVGRRVVPEAERGAVAANLVRGLPEAFASTPAVVDAFADLAAAGLAPGWFDGYAGQIRGVSSRDLLDTAHALLAPARLVVVVVGPLAALRPGLARLGLGRPVEVDASGAVRRQAARP
jgi:predicted Zn-dependent peptidase